MSVKLRGRTWTVYFRPFGKSIMLGLKGVESKRQAIAIEAELIEALQRKDYANLTGAARQAIVRLFSNKSQKWEFPEELKPPELKPPPPALTLWTAFELFVKSENFITAKYQDRYKICMAHLAEHFGKKFPMKDLWIPQISDYRLKRQGRGAAAATVNREVGTLSRIFRVLINHRLLESNPCRDLERLSERDGQREVYVSYADFLKMVEQTWEWFRPIMWAAYLSGMRQGEIISLERKDVDLKARIIKLTPDRTKEEKFKRVPIHQDLLPFLESKVHNLQTNRIFLKDGQPLTKDGFKHPWRLATKGMDERLRFHDIRAVFITNCRRSDISETVLQSIVGHATRMRPITQRYGRVSDQELLSGIDRLMTDHGATEVLTANSKC
jgi:integrase